MKTGVFKAITLGLIICFALSAGCAKLPEEKGSTSEFVSSGSDTASSDAGADGEGVVQVTISTPIPTETEEKPEFSTPPDEDSGPEYSVIYSKEDELWYTIIPFDFELKQPPMVFEYELEIPTLTDEKTGTSKTGGKEEYSVSRTIPNPSAWYTISVYDSETSELIDSKELNSFADIKESGSFKIYRAGKLHVEISGNLLTANTTVMVPPENLE